VRVRVNGPAALGWVLLCLVLVYGGDIGRGFIKDDFSWILHDPLRAPGGLASAFTETPMGFYRPLVAIAFGVNDWISGLAPAPYAWTNLAMAAAIAGLVFVLVSGLGFGRLGGAFAAGLWAFNLHGINMALLWTSGRTSLLGALGAAAAAAAFVRRRYGLAGLFTLAALLGKEEPLLLPVVFAIWAALDGAGDRARVPRAAARATWPAWAAVAVYFILRSRTEAFTPATAPGVYQLHASAIAANALQYLDRSLTFTAAVLALGWLAFSRRPLAFEPIERRTILKGAVWLVFGFALTTMIASRSSLYAVYPSIGSALIGVALGRAIWKTMPPGRRDVATAAALLLPLALWPVYHLRNARLKDEGALSTMVMARIHEAVAAHPSISRIVVYDDPDDRPSASSALGEKLPDAVQLTTGRDIPAVLVPVPPGVMPANKAGSGVLELVVNDGTITTR
jgi:hypothetical protein